MTNGKLRPEVRQEQVRATGATMGKMGEAFTSISRSESILYYSTVQAPHWHGTFQRISGDDTEVDIQKIFTNCHTSMDSTDRILE